MSCECQKEVKVIIQMEHGYADCTPTKAHESDACWDLYSADEIVLAPGERFAISNGFRMAIPIGYEAQIRPRSGNAIKKGLTVLNTPGTVDANYRGIIGTILYNASSTPIKINRGDRVAQMAICKLPHVVLELGSVDCNTDRGEKGFGSTGVVGKS